MGFFNKFPDLPESPQASSEHDNTNKAIYAAVRKQSCKDAITELATMITDSVVIGTPEQLAPEIIEYAAEYAAGKQCGARIVQNLVGRYEVNCQSGQACFLRALK